MHYEFMSQVRHANSQAGHHFFEPSAIRFFDSRVGSTVYGGRYFITSEQFHNRGYSKPRRYSIRTISENGSIDTVGDFQQYNSWATAKRAIDHLLKQA